MAEIFVNNKGEALSVVEDGHKWSASEINSLSGQIVKIKGVSVKELCFMEENKFEKDSGNVFDLLSFRKKIFDTAALSINKASLTGDVLAPSEKITAVNAIIKDA